jgi:predicted component of type VI protein secretion system
LTLELLLREDTNPAEARRYEFPLNGEPLVLGRGPESPVPLEGTRISRQHLAFAFTQGVVTVTDVSSTGVWVNDQAVPKNTPIGVEPVDQIRIPGYLFAATAKRPASVAQATAALPIAAVPPEPAWWRLDGLELWAMLVFAVAVLFQIFYRSF